MPRRTLRNRRTVRGGAPAKAENNKTNNNKKNNNWNNYNNSSKNNSNKNNTNNNKRNNNTNKNKSSNNGCRTLFKERNEAMVLIGEKNLEIRQLKREVAELQNENNQLALELNNARRPRANAGLAAARMNSSIRNVGRRIPFRHL